MFDTNPNVIQNGPRKPAAHNATPLVLIHDGGGTIFSYHLLGDLGRKVVGIANPRFRSSIPWAGGLHEMATAYAGFVAKAVPSGPVILGGWSLGGLLALETAQVLSQTHPDVSVIGLLLVDSVCPVPPDAGWAGAEQRLTEHRIEWPTTTAPATKACVERCFREAHRMVRDWAPPVSQLAPAVLIRCCDPVSAPDDGLLYVDLYRSDQRLGWDNYRRGMFCQVINIPGHHYNVFALEHVDTMTASIKAACETIEQRDLISSSR
ncbi:hypothetical protein SEUCBS139899_008463 [Sporothrix eucalyptigena]|uniref:Thioesterase domain-containing protein n=1 Tax=Sporothrix eucalyptigena TaxID=1812306 RepID=A0ABP0CZM9_9PEZI